MSRRLAVMLSLVVVATALPAGVAHAKGLTGLTVCGADRCVNRDAEVRGNPALTEALMSHDASVADPGPAASVQLRERIGHGGEDVGRVDMTYYPSLGIFRVSDAAFYRADPRSRGAIDAVVAGVRPFAAPGAVAERDAVPAATGATASTGSGGDGGVPVVAWMAGGAAALALFLAGGVTVARRRHGRGPSGRPATG
jgi:hypothetical protein